MWYGNRPAKQDNPSQSTQCLLLSSDIVLKNNTAHQFEKDSAPEFAGCKRRIICLKKYNNLIKLTNKCMLDWTYSNKLPEHKQISQVCVLQLGTAGIRMSRSLRLGLGRSKTMERKKCGKGSNENPESITVQLFWFHTCRTLFTHAKWS